MNTKDTSLPNKPHFFDLCMTHGVSNDVLEVIAEMSGIPKSIVDTMFTTTPVSRTDAEKVLSALSQITGRTWNLDNTDVPLTEEVQ